MTNKEQNQTAATKTSPQEIQRNTAENANAARDTHEKAKPGQEKSLTLNAEIKKVWNKLTDEDINLYEKQPEQFFGRVKDKQGLSLEQAKERMTIIKKACDSACSSNDKKTA